MVELPPAPDAVAAPGPGLLEWTLQIDHLAHPEFFLGVVDPDRAPKTPYCLHSSKPTDGVFLHAFRLGTPLAVEDFCTLLVDVGARTAVCIAVNGFRTPDPPLVLPPDVARVVPVVELYMHGDPRMTIIPLPFLAE